MVFLDIEMPRMKGLDVLREIRKREKDFPVVMITAYGSIDLAVEAMKEGAYDFIPKPFKANHIALVVEKAMERQRLRREKGSAFEESGQALSTRGRQQPKLNAAIGAAKKRRQQEHDLLLGESGTGKGTFRQGDSQLEREKRPALYRHQLRRSLEGAVGE
jgi:DNA-binding NtrC family response regulator